MSGSDGLEAQKALSAELRTSGRFFYGHLANILAGKATEAIERHLSADVPVVRSMPNAPSTVHEGIAGICAGDEACRPSDRPGGIDLRRRRRFFHACAIDRKYANIAI